MKTSLDLAIFVMGDPMFAIRVKEMAEFPATDAMRQVLSACLAANVVGQEASMENLVAIAPMAKRVNNASIAADGAILIAPIVVARVS